ncbi:thioesterase superfamily protein [Oceanithermus profundus DSM 14977]|uniref:Thioesterase superfamily protein n=1 Tax=Oceanithermus profundus (strain DSM 14977 / NBRC 100410 / VKM B-2274 / 506) TaxID=670487 RepID=E4U7R6_OCEP5|nr:thioesterase family protein [Oceanithermus profundus]ADR36515.1 thioesterase superfamily protein [Oceanithermus profundus DSM 14977]
MSALSRFPVRYAETDQMGVVHHAAYVPWLEQGRVDWLAAQGVSYAELERSGVFFPVVGLELAYRRALRFGDTVQVETRLTGLASRRLVFVYRVFREGDAEPAATGRSVHVPQDAAGRIRRLPEALFERLKAAAERET